MRRVLLIYVLFLPFSFSRAQESSEVSGSPALWQRLSFCFSSTGFFRNHEYFNPITEGYTLTGSHFRPVILWQPLEELEIKGGLFIALWSGYGGNPVVKPVFSSTVITGEKARLTLGSLNGSDKHQMLDPHFRIDKFYTDFQEEGVQFVYNGDMLFSDSRINWERFIFHGSNGREELTFGESAKISFSSKSNGLCMEFPLQLLIKHRGGQISNYTEPVETHFNFAIGAGMAGGGEKNKLSVTRGDVTVFIYHTPRQLPGLPFRTGSALWVRGSQQLGPAEVKAGIWIPGNFYSPNGNMMFSSVSDYRPGVVLQNRVLLSGSLNFLKTWETGFCSLFLGFDWYFDPREKNFDHSITLNIRMPEHVYRFPQAINKVSSQGNPSTP